MQIASIERQLESNSGRMALCTTQQVCAVDVSTDKNMPSLA
jgi:hypothetical protein